MPALTLKYSLKVTGQPFGKLMTRIGQMVYVRKHLLFQRRLRCHLTRRNWYCGWCQRPITQLSELAYESGSVKRAHSYLGSSHFVQFGLYNALYEDRRGECASAFCAKFYAYSNLSTFIIALRLNSTVSSWLTRTRVAAWNFWLLKVMVHRLTAKVGASGAL